MIGIMLTSSVSNTYVLIEFNEENGMKMIIGVAGEEFATKESYELYDNNETPMYTTYVVVYC